MRLLRTSHPEISENRPLLLALKVIGILVASMGAMAPAVFLLGSLTVANVVFLEPRVGSAFWNLASGWQALTVFVIEFVILGLAFALLRRFLTEREASHL